MVWSDEAFELKRPFPFNNIASSSLSSFFSFACFRVQVYEGDDGERFERNWLYWTGARMIYR